jgi:calcineurin-like phosphoesterase family protein
MAHFFTADTHFGHANIIKYCNRPFASVEEQDETLIANWNRLVKPGDHVFHLGDFCMHGDLSEYRKRLNGKITLIRGNHDKLKAAEETLFEGVHDLLRVQMCGADFILCHYAMRVWDKSHWNSFHLYGHSHGHMEPYGKSMDVGVDTTLAAYAPIPAETIKQVMDALPNNPNWISREGVR